MVSKLAVTALVIIVAAPILLGYGLAFEEVPYVSYETSDRINVTDRVLNSTNPIYMTSTAPQNNSQLLASITYAGSGVTETSIKAPAYVNTGSNPTSIPVYTSKSGYLYPSVSTNTTQGIDQGGYSTTGIFYNAGVPLIRISPDQLSQVNLYDLPYTSAITAGTYLVALQSESQKWSTNFDGEHTFSSFEVLSDRYPTYAITRCSYLDVTSIGDNYYLRLSQPSVIKLNYSGGGNGYVPISSVPSGGLSVIKEGSRVMVGNDAYTNVASISIASLSTMIEYSRTVQVDDTYANPSYGWTTDIAGENPYRAYWMNSQVNNSIRMLAEIQNDEFVDIQVMNGDTATGWMSLRKTAGNVTVNGSSLGTYTYLSMEISGSKITVSGINSWPNMHTVPAAINSITVDLESPIENFDRVWLNGSKTINYRVDSAEILSGYFATTEDAIVDMGALWPDKSFVLSMSSIGIYGDTISFAGQTYDVTDGSITVDGKKVRLLKAAFSAVYDEETETYTASIDGIDLNTELPPSPIAPALGLGGEWSMALMAYNVEKIEGTHKVWQAGEFAFNGADSSFALLGLLTCGAVFIGLGMYGRRSGAKVGMLMMVTGCAALIFLAMI